jgi:lantibiotic biosynthesis protein
VSFEAMAADMAARIADHLCDAAVRDAGRCAWLGTTQDAADNSDQVEFVYGTIGPELYGGNAGVALFLAEAAARMGNRHWRETAVAGMAHALDRADAIAPDARVSFHLGQVGLGYAAAIVARVSGNPETASRARALLSRLPSVIPGDLTADPLSGGTGAIAPLLALAELLEQSTLRRLALELGECTAAAATRGPDGWSWPPAIEAVRPLTGMSHGAAGIGHALLELGVATGRSDLLEAAHGAFAYEDRWYRPAEENWPDFRDADADALCCAAWCHGAPGIALSRIRAVELGFEQYRPGAEAALRTTRAALADRDGWVDGDWSLCHGLGGLTEVLRTAEEAPNQDAAAEAAERFGGEIEAWPCGVRRGSNPSLMLGLAGIGYCYLGLADSTLPPILLTGPGTAI